MLSAGLNHEHLHRVCHGLEVSSRPTELFEDAIAPFRPLQIRYDNASTDKVKNQTRSFYQCSLGNPFLSSSRP